PRAPQPSRRRASRRSSSTARSPRPRNSCSASMWSIATRLTRCSGSPVISPAPIPAAATRSAPFRSICRERCKVNDWAFIDRALTAARPQALSALLRYFRDLDTAEEAYQEACLRALGSWPRKGQPRDPAAWLIFVGRNVGIDALRRQRREQAMPPEELI